MLQGSSIRQPDERFDSNILLLETRPIRNSDRCISLTLEQEQTIGESALGINSTHLVKSYSQQGNNNDNCPLLGISSMVSPSNGSLDSTNIPPISKHHIHSYSPSATESSTESSMENPRVQHLWSRYETKGLSQEAINLLISTIDPNSTRTVSSALRVWSAWCEPKSINPVTYSVNKIIDFLTESAKSELSYNTIAGYHTAISEIHEQDNSLPIGSDPDISKIIKAIYAENPLIPHTDEAIDITPSLNYIRDLGNNHTMSIRGLSIKTAFLLTLVTTLHPSDLKRINLSSMQKTTSAITFDCIYQKEYKIT
ncbi:hypothetical protein RclHR1_04270012 [Rhizophagus clarus]|uniref:Core-binding (CB) domain-containing protein n=1 Tax=Rhizophagus clarus TaxID=94130 RepID=A0A2Z6RHR0_9GLOM|nr:hypothetical protein RclHR1_04270012 [Rhizophagus clarus]